MKQLIILLIACVVQLCAKAQLPTQDPYPNTVTAATQINKYIFFVDSVSTVNLQPLAFIATIGNTTAATAISLVGVTSGVHQLYAQVVATNGVPSITDLGYFYMEGGTQYANVPAFTTQINKYSFFIDSVSTVNEQPLAFAAAANNNTPSSPINLTGVTPGVHQLYAKVTTTNGVPSITNLGNFYMEGSNLYANVPTAATAINRYEFFIDSVTTTNIQPLAFTSASQNSTANVTVSLLGVLPGIHQLYARVFTTNNIPSIINFGLFAMDQNFRYANIVAPAAPLQNMEYYVDTDLGFGLATAITISGNNTAEILNNISINIPNNLATGIHFLHIRSRQNPWSIDNALPFSVGAVVPVTWLYVKAQLLDDNSLVQWATANELNSSLFDVEWSTNGINFSKIGSLNAAGNSTNVSTYNFTHTKPVNSFNYYRIKQVDMDGSFRYSEIVKVFQKQKETITIFPNPATTQIQVNFSGKEKTVMMAVFDAQGKQVMQTLAQNTTPIKLNVQALPSGKYFIQISDTVLNKKASFIKQ